MGDDCALGIDPADKYLRPASRPYDEEPPPSAPARTAGRRHGGRTSTRAGDTGTAETAASFAAQEENR